LLGKTVKKGGGGVNFARSPPIFDR